MLLHGKISPDHRVVERKIKLGLETPTKYEVSSGLSEKELVEIAGKDKLKVSDTVMTKMIELNQAGRR